MRSLIYSMGVSLDGYIAGPRGEGGWAAPDAELHRFHNEQARELDLHLLGRRLYEVMTYWETAEERKSSAPKHELEFARIWKQLPKLVYSKSLEAVEGNTRLSGGDPAQEVQALKEQDGGPIGVGAATLAASLTAHGVIDEYRLFVSPVVLGGGKPFFAGDTHDAHGHRSPPSPGACLRLRLQRETRPGVRAPAWVQRLSSCGQRSSSWPALLGKELGSREQSVRRHRHRLRRDDLSRLRALDQEGRRGGMHRGHPDGRATDPLGSQGPNRFRGWETRWTIVGTTVAVGALP